MSEISSGLVAVAWQVRNGWSSCDLYRTLKSATEDRDMLQKRADFAGNLMAYRVEPLVRLSDAEAIIAQQSERIKELESEVDEEAHIRDRMAKLLAETAVALKGPEKALHRHGWQDLPEVASKQSAALKLAKEVLEDAHQNINPERGYADEIESDIEKAIAAINEVLKGE